VFVLIVYHEAEDCQPLFYFGGEGSERFVSSIRTANRFTTKEAASRIASMLHDGDSDIMATQIIELDACCPCP